MEECEFHELEAASPAPPRNTTDPWFKINSRPRDRVPPTAYRLPPAACRLPPAAAALLEAAILGRGCYRPVGGGKQGSRELGRAESGYIFVA